MRDVGDPWQAGHVKVQWEVGSAAQDQLGVGDLPWTRVMFPSTNPSLKKTGGPHTGLRVGSKVYGWPVDGAGQDFVIVGSLLSAGTGEPDQQQTNDSEAPTGTKQQDVDGITQPHYADHNDVAKKHGGQDVVTQSIVDYARDEGGPDKRPCKYADPSDTVGDDQAIV